MQLLKIKIQYVGKKPSAVDNVARSGITWNGNGDVKEVTPDQAKILLKFPDQWALASEVIDGESESKAQANEDNAQLDQPKLIQVDGADGKEVAVNADELGIPLEKMSHSQLRAYAVDKFDKKFATNISRKTLLDEVLLLEKTVG